MFHKKTGQLCPDCPHYAPRNPRILITKLDALGDVLRTTALLPGLRAKYPDGYIVWITRGPAADLFRNNPLVDELWIAETDAIARLRAETFDLVINPDADRWTAALAAQANATERLGLTLDPRGSVIPANPEAEEWLEMGAFDPLKKANRKTYQQILYEMCRMPYARQKPVLRLTTNETREAGVFLSTAGRDSGRKLIGMNLGGGGRWKNKRWTEENITAFCRTVSSDPALQLLVLGGAYETELMERLKKERFPGAIFSGTNRTLRELSALVAACDVLVSGDTLGLHIATALDVPVVALFGPTSAAEIELYDNGVALTPDMDCCCCYLPTCPKDPVCVARISPEQVFQNVQFCVDGRKR